MCEKLGREPVGWTGGLVQPRCCTGVELSSNPPICPRALERAPKERDAFPLKRSWAQLRDEGEETPQKTQNSAVVSLTNRHGTFIVTCVGCNSVRLCQTSKDSKSRSMKKPASLCPSSSVRPPAISFFFFFFHCLILCLISCQHTALTSRWRLHLL